MNVNAHKYGMVVMLSASANQPVGEPARRPEWRPNTLLAANERESA
jgi:hypothetical protein